MRTKSERISPPSPPRARSASSRSCAAGRAAARRRLTRLPMRLRSSRRIMSSMPVTGSPSSRTTRSCDSSPALARRPVLVDRGQHRAEPVLDAGFDRVPARHRHGLRGDADIGAPHAAVHDDLAQHVIGGVAGDREADALRAHDHRGVDADHLAARGHQRPAGIAGVERGVGLDHVLDHAAGGGAQASARARRSRRRSRSTRSRADCRSRSRDGRGCKRLGIAERREREAAGGVGAQQREVGVGIDARAAAPRWCGLRCRTGGSRARR